MVNQANLALWIVAIPSFASLVGVAGLSVRAARFPWFRKMMEYLTLGASFISLALSVLLVAQSLVTPNFQVETPIFGVDWLIDSLSVYFVLLVNIIAFFASWSSIRYLADQTPTSFWQDPILFYTLINLFHVTMLIVPFANNLIVLWIAIEATTLVSAMLVGFQNKRESWEAAWKYLIITSTGIIFALLGTMFLANAVPEALRSLPEVQNNPNSVMNWTFLLVHAKELASSSDFVRLSFLFILVGYGTKAGLAPMHTWLPDGHGEAPAPISALLSGVLLKSALYAVLRFYTITNAVLFPDKTFTSAILLSAGLLSLIIATPFILKEKNRFKRVLAYHSLEHMGIITFGIGIGGQIALFGALLHALNHAITKALMFLSFGNVIRQYEKKRIEQADIKGVLRSMPVTGAIMTLGGLALVGTPPFNIFMSEFIILWGAFGALKNSVFPPWIIAVAIGLFILSTTLIFYGLIRHLAKLVLHKLPDDARLEETWKGDLPPLAVLLGFVTLFGVTVIPPISNLITNSANIVLNVNVR
jgi:hydrogenase-4 component F